MGGVVVVNQPGVHLVDEDGNLLEITNDGGAYKVEVIGKLRDSSGSIIDPVTKAQLPASLVGGRLNQNVGSWFGSTVPTVGQKTMANSVPIVIANDQTTLSVTSGASLGTGSVSAFLLNGSSPDLVVDGSGTPVKFSFEADASDDIQLVSLRFVISVGGSFDFDGGSFAEGGALSNGISVNIVANGGAFDRQLTELKVNEDFARLLDFQPFSDIDAVITSTLPFGGNVILEGGSSDEVSVTVNDNVALGGRGVDYFTATIYGVVL